MATFGKTTDGTNVQTFSGDRIYLSTATPAASGTVTSGWGRVRVTGASVSEIRVVIFSDSGGEPANFLAQSDEVVVDWTTSTLTEFPFSGGNQISITSGTPYWIGFWADDPGTPSYEYKRDNTSSVNRFRAEAYPGGGTPTTPWSSDGSSNGPLNVYIEFTEGTTTSTSQSTSTSRSTSTSSTSTSFSTSSTSQSTSTSSTSSSTSTTTLPLTQTLTDDFDDNSLDAAKWTDWGGAQTNETAQQLQMTSTTASGYYGIDSVQRYNMSGSYIYIQLPDMGSSTITSWEVYPLSAKRDADNEVFWAIVNNGGTIELRVYHKKATVLSNPLSLSYNATTHAWLRIRESGGTYYWDTSTDGSSWTNRYSQNNLMAADNMLVNIFVGTWQAEASTTTAKFDNFNVTGGTTTSTSSTSSSISTSSTSSSTSTTVSTSTSSTSSSTSRSTSTSSTSKSTSTSSTSASTSTSTTAPPGTWSSRVQAWIYPGSPAQNADEEYRDGRVINTLKPEYYTVNTDGVLVQLVDPDDGENAYNTSNAIDVQDYSTHQYFTISADAASMAALCGNGTKRTNAINTIISFLDTIGFTGVELDWEGFGSWTSTSYADYITFVTALGNALHAEGYKLMIDGPPIGNVTEQGYYEWTYSDFNSLPVDYICVMAYDYQYDYGGGESVAPVAWVEDIIDWVKGEITTDSKIVIGLPSYGYHATTGGFNITIDTKAQSALLPGYSGASRNADYEMEWTNGGNSYIYQDSTSMNSKREVIEAKGIEQISVWHLGGNDWFTGNSEPEEGTTTSTSSTSSSISTSSTSSSTSRSTSTSSTSSSTSRSTSTSSTSVSVSTSSTSSSLSTSSTSSSLSTSSTSASTSQSTSTSSTSASTSRSTSTSSTSSSTSISVSTSSTSQSTSTSRSTSTSSTSSSISTSTSRSTSTSSTSISTSSTSTSTSTTTVLISYDRHPIPALRPIAHRDVPSTDDGTTMDSATMTMDGAALMGGKTTPMPPLRGTAGRIVPRPTIRIRR